MQSAARRSADCIIANAIEPFNAANETVQVEAAMQANTYDATRTALAGGSGPDIVSTPGPSEGIQLAKAGLLLPLDDYAAAVRLGGEARPLGA